MPVDFRERLVDVEGHSLLCRETGSGDPILLVHGITTYSFIWEPIIPALAESHHVIAVDLLGCGGSDKPLDQSYGLKAHAERIALLAETLGLGPFHYVGHDLGGGIGQILAVRRPELLRDLVLVNTVAYDFWPVQPIIAMRTPIVRELAMASLDLGAFRLIVKRALHHKERLDDRLMESFRKPLATAEGRKAFLHFAHCLNNRDLVELSEELKAIRMPVLIVRGQADPYLSAAISDKLHGEIPGSALLQVPTGGHYLMIDEPEILSSAILGFIDRRGAGS